MFCVCLIIMIRAPIHSVLCSSPRFVTSIGCNVHKVAAFALHLRLLADADFLLPDSCPLICFRILGTPPCIVAEHWMNFLTCSSKVKLFQHNFLFFVDLRSKEMFLPDEVFMDIIFNPTTLSNNNNSHIIIAKRNNTTLMSAVPPIPILKKWFPVQLTWR